MIDETPRGSRRVRNSFSILRNVGSEVDALLYKGAHLGAIVSKQHVRSSQGHGCHGFTFQGGATALRTGEMGILISKEK